MTVKELKQRLIYMIDQSENNELLEEMYRLISNKNTDFNFYDLSEEQIKAVEEGQLQYKKGKFLTDEQADKNINMTMTILEIKNQVIGKINQLTDDELLMDVYKILNDSSLDSEIYRLSDNHQIAVDTAVNQINRGDFLTSVQANKEINEWLSK
jgi:hypothetical protein